MNTLLRRFAKASLPPALQKALKRAETRAPWKRPLFEGSDAMFMDVVKMATTYGEYGCGASTEWVIANTNARVYSVDTSMDWIEVVAKRSNHDARLTTHHVDVGPLGDWGRPESYAFRANFIDYTDWMWNQEPKPDVVLIDGRFRVACFLTTALRASAGTTILFDDYVNRPQYHIVEEILPRVEVSGRQCRFIVPPSEELNPGDARELLERFRYVMD